MGSNQLCWSCRNAVPSPTCGCSWSRAGKPVDGWKATKVQQYENNEEFRYRKPIISYQIDKCPKYEMDEHSRLYMQRLKEERAMVEYIRQKEHEKRRAEAKKKAKMIAMLNMSKKAMAEEAKKRRQMWGHRILLYRGGNMFEVCRLRAQMTQSQAGFLAGLSYVTIGRVEHGVQRMEETNRRKLAEAYKCNLDDLSYRMPTDEEIEELMKEFPFFPNK